MIPLTSTVLHDLADGRLDGAAKTAVEQALAGADGPTRDRWRFAEAWRAQTREAPLYPLPAELVRALTEAYAHWRAATAADETGAVLPLGWVRRVVALLEGDAALGGLAPAGVRGGPLLESSAQYSFSAPEIEIVVNAARRVGGAGYDLYGQLLFSRTPPPDDGVVQICAEDRVVGAAAADELGEFLLTGVAPGTYRLEIAVEGVEILTAPFRVGA